MIPYTIILTTIFLPIIAYVVVYRLERRAGTKRFTAHRRTYMWLIKNLSAAYAVGIILILGYKFFELLIG